MGTLHGQTKYLFGNNMKTAFRILIIPAALWALIAPGSYGLLFGVGGDWSAIIDLVIVLCCLVLAISLFIKVSSSVWCVCLLLLSTAVFVGLLHHFQDSGESGPLPFEWLNRYLTQGLPLLVLAIADRIWAKTRNAEPERPTDFLHAARSGNR